MMRVASVGLLLVAALGLLAGQADAVSPLPPQVPFVGCPSEDAASGDPIAAPQSSARTAPVDGTLASQIAYYAGPGADWRPGVYAPRGWHCRAWSGADGAFLIVTPEPPPDTNPHAPIQGPRVVASLSIGATGGRFDMAQIGARCFPNALQAFIQRLLSYLDETNNWTEHHRATDAFSRSSYATRKVPHAAEGSPRTDLR